MSRGRRYDFSPLPGFKNGEAAMMTAILEEAAERLFDVLSYTDATMLHFIPTGSYLSIATLAKHMAVCDAIQVQRISGKKAPDEMLALLGDASPGSLKNSKQGDETADGLVAAIRELRSSYILPNLATVEDIDTLIEPRGGIDTVRKILMHLIWHWTYHSGQVGLTLLQAGYDYTWAFA